MSNKPHPQKITPKKIKKQLSPRHQTFCREYLIDFIGTKAAIRAGFSEHTAAEQASRLLSKVKIQEEINRLRREREKRLEASADFVVREFMRIAKFDIRDLYDKNGNLKDIKDLPEDVAKCISAIDVDELWGPNEDGPGKSRIGTTKKVKAWDKVRALEALGEHFGIFKRLGVKGADEEEAKHKKRDLLQVIKILSKDGQITTIENRVGESSGAADGMDQPGPGNIRIL
jgi:phage terminase small subunit